MTPRNENIKYSPENYARKRTSIEELVDHYVRNWEKKVLTQKKKEVADASPASIPPCIAFSRKIGVGALQIADMVGKKLGYKVADRELIEQIAGQANISEKATAFFDERFPGYGSRTIKYLFGEKAFIDSDYARHLINVVNAIAGLEPTVFVGRGSHLILPRERVLAVRCICNDEYRIRRISRIMEISESDAKKQLPTIDSEQAAFFKKVFNKKAALPYEFDLVLNLDHIAKPESAADIVVLAFRKKFEMEL